MSEYPNDFWHCRVVKKGDKQGSDIRDLTFAQLQTKVIGPFKNGHRFPIAGKLVSAEDIEEIQIVRTPNKDDFNSKRFYDSLSPGIFMLYHGPFSVDDASDYTHELLFADDTPPARAIALAGTDVFVVHGRDDALRGEVCRTLEKLGLRPVVLSEQVDKGLTIIEKFEDHSNVAYAVVLITPDDHGGLRGQGALKPRARQNVVFELGFFYGKLGRQRVCALVKEGVEFPSDIHGVIYKTADAAGAWKFQIATEMKAAGLHIDLNRLG